MNNYESVYKNVGTTPRTLDEAFKTADYATPLWRCEDDTDRAKNYFVNLGVIVFFSILLISIFAWLGE